MPWAPRTAGALMKNDIGTVSTFWLRKWGERCVWGRNHASTIFKNRKATFYFAMATEMKRISLPPTPQPFVFGSILAQCCISFRWTGVQPGDSLCVFTASLDIICTPCIPHPPPIALLQRHLPHFLITRHVCLPLHLSHSLLSTSTVSLHSLISPPRFQSFLCTSLFFFPLPV